jgi:hypothetical protein
MQAATLTPVAVVVGLREAGYTLYPVLERVVRDHKEGPYSVTRVTGTRFKGKGRPAQPLLDAAAEHRPFVAALVVATDPGSTGRLKWPARMIRSYKRARPFEIAKRHHCLDARTVAVNLGALCGLRSEKEISLLTPMIKEVLSR